MTGRGAIRAAGGVLWRGEPGRPEVAVVHRPRYDDWSLPKGKTAPGEPVALTAVREVAEETGHRGRLGRPLGRQRYLRQLNGTAVPKTVHFWAMATQGGSFRPNDEVDELRWLAVAEAARLLTLDRDRDTLGRFLAGPPDTVPLLLVRHASAGDRDRWPGEDRNRPLDARGRRQSAALVALLDCFAPRQVLSADVVRCLDTVQPYADARGLPVDSEPLFSEGGFASHPQAAVRRLSEIMTGGTATVVCSQGGVIPALLAAAPRRADVALPARLELGKGALWALQLADGVVASLERHSG